MEVDIIKVTVQYRFQPCEFRVPSFNLLQETNESPENGIMNQ
ncbi:17980_t:CDS:2 [Dentiscutata erythropus]|uniref:17980_t:CDS:1 n=1 Tax=Dentiscutata erythropus TaxID=1348616 RepID=A0A9N8W0H7_9GLOM|nr:17980_t:CDS:2 [Dentiscutata erythropus]